MAQEYIANKLQKAADRLGTEKAALLKEKADLQRQARPTLPYPTLPYSTLLARANFCAGCHALICSCVAQVWHMCGTARVAGFSPQHTACVTPRALCPCVLSSMPGRPHGSAYSMCSE